MAVLPSYRVENRLPFRGLLYSLLASLLMHAATATDGAPGYPFRSALGEDLTALVLQYTMYDLPARAILTADPRLTHLYRGHERGFAKDGVELTGAGDAQMNGFYARRGTSDKPPRGWAEGDDWARENAGAYWYEKDDDCFIFCSRLEHLPRCPRSGRSAPRMATYATTAAS